MTDLGSIPFVAAAHQSGSIDTRPAEIIVMHSMECPPDDKHVTNWVQSLSTQAGSPYFAHYYTGPGVTYQVAQLGRTVPHVGNGNQVRGRWTLGIEQAGYAAQTRQQWIDAHSLNTAAPLVAALIAAGHGAARWLEPADLAKPGIRGVTSHNNMRIAFGGTTHTDPGPGYPTDLLLANADTGNPPPQPPPPPTTSEDNMISSARNADGRLEVFRVTAFGTVQHAWQPAPDKDLGAFVDMPGVQNISHGITAVEGQSGRIELFAYADDYSVFHCWQVAPNSGWSGWAKAA